MLRKTTPIGNPSSSDVVISICVCVQLNHWLQWLSIVILFNLRYCVTIVVDKKSSRKHIYYKIYA